MDHPHPQRKHKKKKGRRGSNSSGSSSPLAQVSSALVNGGLSRESSSGSLTAEPLSPSMSSTPPSVDKNLLNEILGEIRDLKQRLPGSPKGGSNSSTPPLEDSPSTSTFLQHIEGEKNRVRAEMEKKVLEEDNAKLRQKNTDLQDQFEYWKNRYNKLKDEVDEHHTESDANLSEMYTRIGDLEAKVSGLEAERKQLLLQLKTKDSQLDALKEKYIDLQNVEDKRIDITKVIFDKSQEGKAGIEKGAEETKEKEEESETKGKTEETNHQEEKSEEKKEEKREEGEAKDTKGDGEKEKEKEDKEKEEKEKEDKEKEEKEKEEKEREEKEKEAKQEVAEIVKEVVEDAVKEAAGSAKREAETKSDGSEDEIKQEKQEKKETQKKKQEKKEEKTEEQKIEEKKIEDAKREREELPKRRHRSRLEKAMASGKLENISTNTLDGQFARAISHSKSGSPLVAPGNPSSKSQELEAIADILKHDNEEAPLSPEMTNETEPDDLMLNLNKISYREGTMGRLPSTYSFSELDQVPSFGSLDDDESGKEKTPTTTPTPTPVTTLRTSTERKKHNATGAPEYERKVVLAQSVVRKAQAKKRYKQIRKRASIAREIFLTERTYVRHLLTCIRVFLRPLRQRAIVSQDDFITIEKLQTIFSTFEIIMKANYTFLKRLHLVIKTWNVDTIVGPLFIDLLPLLEPHVDFIVNFEYAQTLLKDAIRDSASFAMFLRASLSNPDLECKDMADFLIMPVQRIPRYVMLFQDLLRNTPPKHPDYNNIQIAVQKIKEFADMINDRKRSQYKIFQIKDCIVGVKDVDLGNVGRFLIHEGDLKTKKDVEHLFLFNDLLLCCKAKKAEKEKDKEKKEKIQASPVLGSVPSVLELDYANNPFKFLSKLNIDTKARVEDTKDPKNPFNIKLSLGDHSTHIFTAASPEDKQRWLSAFNRAILHSPNPFTGPQGGYDVSSTDLRQL